MLILSGTEEPSGLPSMGSHRVGHDWSDLAAAAAILFGENNLYLKIWVESAIKYFNELGYFKIQKLNIKVSYI